MTQEDSPRRRTPDSTGEIDDELDRIAGILPLRPWCPECGQRRVLFPSAAGRVFLDCRGAHR
jgi:hypothetical protein